MVTNEDLKKIVMLGYMTDEMREKLCPMVDVLNFEEREMVFRQGDHADRFYMLRRGKILFEQKMSDEITVAVGSVKPGYSFGWSSMLDGKSYTSEAVCAEACQVYSVRGRKMKQLLDSDLQMGSIFYQRLLRVVKSRLDHRTEQFVQVIRHHPDLRSLFEDQAAN